MAQLTQDEVFCKSGERFVAEVFKVEEKPDVLWRQDSWKISGRISDIITLLHGI